MVRSKGGIQARSLHNDSFISHWAGTHELWCKSQTSQHSSKESKQAHMKAFKRQDWSSDLLYRSQNSTLKSVLFLDENRAALITCQERPERSDYGDHIDFSLIIFWCLITQCSCSPLTRRGQQDACGQQISPWHEHSRTLAPSARQHILSSNTEPSLSPHRSRFLWQFLLCSWCCMDSNDGNVSLRNTVFLKTTLLHLHQFWLNP